MDRRNRWSIILSYLAGIFLLAVSVLLAWFVPGAYSEWQDHRMLKVSVLSSRDDIEFLDMDTLEMETRMRMLKETKQMLYLDYGNYNLGEAEISEKRNVCQKELQQWADCGLMPEEYVDLLSEECWVEGVVVNISLSETILPCKLLYFEDKLQERQMFVILDDETDIIYYVAIYGYVVQEYMAARLGYDSLEYMCWEVLEGRRKELQEDYSGYDFEAVCRAENARITGEKEELNFDVALEYETFTGYANRRVIGREGTNGLAISLGTEKWEEFLWQATGYDDSQEWFLTTKEWQRRLVMALYGVEIEYADVNEQSYARAYEEEVIVQENAQEKIAADKMQ